MPTEASKESLHTALDRRPSRHGARGSRRSRRRPTAPPGAPSGTSVLGLPKQLAGAELGWLCLPFGRACDTLPFDGEGEGDEASEWHVAADESAEDVLDFHARSRAAAYAAIAGLDIDNNGTAFAFFDGATGIRTRRA
ncbi:MULTISPECIES: DUF664 domain-containing protein [Streptomyces]|uniref:mycothiol transferase n=1 Tax=Streptomyces TaxID=1883 RepID=UPI001EE68924|nr:MULTISPECIES: DUF664 domain-containing protein [Streptomyces]